MSLEDKISLLIDAIERLNLNIKELSRLGASEKASEKIIPLVRWDDIHKWPSEAAMRNIVFNKNHNGADSFIIKLGSRIYIDQDKFFEWAKSNPDLSFKHKRSDK